MLTYSFTFHNLTIYQFSRKNPSLSLFIPGIYNKIIIKILGYFWGVTMEVNENFLVTFILNSLPPKYGPFHMNYNTLKDKWNARELQSILI